MKTTHRRALDTARFASLGLLVLTTVVLAGCMSMGTKVTADQLANFKVGVTTEAEVISALGPPNNSTTHADGTKSDTYMHFATSSHPASFIPVVGIFSSGASSSTDTVILMFDAHRVLKSVTTSAGQSDMNTGLLNQK